MTTSWKLSLVTTASIISIFLTYNYLAAANSSAKSSNTSAEKRKQALKPNDPWKILSVIDLNEDDKIIWKKFHGEKSPGRVELSSKCFPDGKEFVLFVRQENGKTFEKLVNIDKFGRHKIINGPDLVVSPFVIWKTPAGDAKDLESGKKYKATEWSLIFEKMESVSYQYICHNNNLIKITVSE